MTSTHFYFSLYVLYFAQKKFFYHEYTLILLKERREGVKGRGRKGAGGAMGREGKREREKERKKRRGTGKRRRENRGQSTEGRINQRPTNQ